MSSSKIFNLFLKLSFPKARIHTSKLLGVDVGVNPPVSHYCIVSGLYQARTGQVGAQASQAASTMGCSEVSRDGIILGRYCS